MKRSEQVLEEVSRKHGLPIFEILGRCRTVPVVAARREAILTMTAMGMKQGVIAKIMKRERTTILEYTNPNRAAYKSKYHADNWRRWQAARDERECAS